MGNNLLEAPKGGIVCTKCKTMVLQHERQDKILQANNGCRCHQGLGLVSKLRLAAIGHTHMQDPKISLGTVPPRRTLLFPGQRFVAAAQALGKPLQMVFTPQLLALVVHTLVSQRQIDGAHHR